ncbi:unnamed protein product [Schistocephalus solidus]|uniref:Uncharacterized protein n=1 Tax=Schistocephalus solidus TaxID=70667 RepID=A0A3P7CXM3_SCHSO|nr:unnamed protein product [Schistocephalus solidus]
MRECPDLQLFLVYVVSMDPASLCSTEYRFSQFLRALSPYHKALDPSATPPPHLLQPFALDVLELGASLPTSWRLILRAFLFIVNPCPRICCGKPTFHHQDQESEKRACGRPLYSPLGDSLSAMMPLSYDSAGTLPALQTPADSVARLPNTFDPVGMSDVDDLFTAGGAGAATCSSTVGTGKYAVTVASPPPSVAAPFVGPEENQMACARLLQKLAREILQAAENFENQSALAPAGATAPGVIRSLSPAHHSVP